MKKETKEESEFRLDQEELNDEEETLSDLIDNGKLVPVGHNRYELHVFGQPLKSSKNLNTNFILDIAKIKSLLDSRAQESQEDSEFRLDQAELNEEKEAVHSSKEESQEDSEYRLDQEELKDKEETQEESEFRMDQAELQD